jgi:hypothetical protein
LNTFRLRDTSRQAPPSTYTTARKPSNLYKKTPMRANPHRAWPCGPLSMWRRRIRSDSWNLGTTFTPHAESILLRPMGHGSIISGQHRETFPPNADLWYVWRFLCGDATKSPPTGASRRAYFHCICRNGSKIQSGCSKGESNRSSGIGLIRGRLTQLYFSRLAKNRL